MTRRIPVVATIVVALAVAAMVALGIWQLRRLHEKEQLLARYQANQSRPLTAFAAVWPVRDEWLYRRVGVTCLTVTGWRVQAGRSADGVTGWRHIASCSTGAEGPGVLVDMGVSDQSAAPKGWTGGRVSGRLIWSPAGEPLVERLFVKPAAPTPMIVSEQPAPGLARSADPTPAAIPNNHLAYAVQWFLFAAVAAIIYGVALRRRGRSVAPPPPQG